jgi:hypothetical protein
MTQAARSTPTAFVVFAFLLSTLLACAARDIQTPGSRGTDTTESQRNYLHLVTMRGPASTTYLMHWPNREMPLQVYLPPSPPGLFEDPEEVQAAVRAGILDWADVIEPGLPGFEFVDDQREADTPIVWAEESTGDWFIAFLSPQVRVATRFGVSHILVTGRWDDGQTASREEIHAVVLHEMGHALGLMGHSDDQRDVIWPSIYRIGTGLSVADVETLRLLYERPSRRASGRRSSR